MDKELNWHKSVFSASDEKEIFQTLSKSLARAASLWPESVAVICGEKTHSFLDLACRVAGLAEEINEAASSYGPVALVQSLGFDAIASWFACSLSGRPFVLLEPDHPPARLLEMIEAASCVLVLGDHATPQVLRSLPKSKFLISDGRSGKLDEDKGLRAEEPSMIFPTSGSTGQPKLIVYSASTIQAKVQSSLLLMRIPKGARVLIASTHGNFAYLHHAFAFLFSGGAICLSNIKAGGFDVLLKAIVHQGVRHVRFTPSLFRKLSLLPQVFPTLGLLDGIRFSGEPLLENDLKLANAIFKPECLIQNIYGSTESALFIWSNVDDPQNETEATVPIGKIYPSSSYAIRPLENEDDKNNIGELLIRSAFHALGDLKEGIIVKERFIQIENSKNERIYATGDIVRLRPDGNLIHLGRMGRMVKIRGNRIFLSEVENHLRTIPGVTGAAAIEHVDRDIPALYGFITTDGSTITSSNARSWLASRLPDFMLPQNVETISQIPLLVGGKVDYAGLVPYIPNYLQSETTYENTPSNDRDFVRLCYLWDSLLWTGAHKQAGNFLALGGDSLGLMLLSVEVERVFGQQLPLLEFRNNSTLKNLADILHINHPAFEMVEKKEKVQFDQFDKSLKASKGVALAMPGYGGWATAYPFKKAELFDDHDIWTADFPIKKGTILESRRWRKVAYEIVDRIKDGTIPPPRIIFGYSVGGGLAWLVGHLLKGTPQCPKFIVMVDAPPLHRFSTFHDLGLKKALDLVSHHQPPSAIHIRRAPLPNIVFGSGSTNLWEPIDHIRMFVELPTVDHLETIRWNMLAMAKEAVSTFLNHHESPEPWKPTLAPPDLLGVYIHHAANGCENSLQKVMEEWKKAPEMFHTDQLMALIFVLRLKNETHKANELIASAVKKLPNSRIVQYLKFRSQRSGNMLITENMPEIYPLIISSLEVGLVQSDNNLYQSKPRLIKLICLALDVFSIFVVVEWENFKRRCSQRNIAASGAYAKLFKNNSFEKTELSHDEL